MEGKKDLPTLLVIAGTNEEDWVKLCSEYSSKFRVIQTTWEKISFSSYSDSKYPMVSVHPNKRPLYPSQKELINNIKPELVLIRNLARYIGTKLEVVPDFRNIFYGFYHANTPMINGFEAIMAELMQQV